MSLLPDGRGADAGVRLVERRTAGRRQVLLLNSFERGSATENLFAGSFRTELGKQSPEPLNFFEVSLQPALTAETLERLRSSTISSPRSPASALIWS